MYRPMALLYALSPYALFPAAFSLAAYSSRCSGVRLRTDVSSISGSSDSLVTDAAWGCDGAGVSGGSAALRSASFRFRLSFLLIFGPDSSFDF